MTLKPLAEIFVEGLSIFCIIGDLPHERMEPQEITVDIYARLDPNQCGCSDSLDDSVDYVALASLATNIAQTQKFHLVEALAASIAKASLAQHLKLNSIRIKVTKSHCIPNARACGIEYTLTR